MLRGFSVNNCPNLKELQADSMSSAAKRFEDKYTSLYAFLEIGFKLSNSLGFESAHPYADTILSLLDLEYNTTFPVSAQNASLLQ